MSRAAATVSIKDGNRDIPGFYYDETKKRYFKVAHAATGGQHTASALVKRRRLERDSQLERHRETSRAENLSRVRRLKRVAADALLHGRSVAEVPRLLNQVRLFSQGLEVDPARSRLLNPAGHRTKIAYNAPMQELYVAASRFIEAHTMSCHSGEEQFGNLAHDSQIRRMMPIAPLRSAASSLTFRDGLLLGTSVGEAHRPAEVIIKTAQGGKISTIDGTLWCSAIQPDSARFAAAGSSVLLYDSLRTDDARQEIKIKGHTDVMSMDFLDNNVLCLGCRNGAVQLYDVRTSNPSTSPRFNNVKAISKGGQTARVGISRVHALGSQSLIVSGLQNTLHTYDIRYLKADMPFVTFLGHKNEYDMSLNSLGVCGDLLVVAQESCNAKLWDLSGEYLGSKQTECQIDDLVFPQAKSEEHDTMWTMSKGRLDQWRFDP